jgi:hypothetical protein
MFLFFRPGNEVKNSDLILVKSRIENLRKKILVVFENDIRNKLALLIHTVILIS